MHFQYPAFLFALSVLAIPVIIHLFNFRRYKKVYFSNVQFLKQVHEQEAGGRKLKERLILLSRLLALFFLVMAFAKPYLSQDNSAISGRQQVVSVFVDNSNSMQALGNEGSLLEEAKSKAKDIAAAYGPNTKFQLITQDFFGKDQRLIDKAEFNNEIDGVILSSQSHNLENIVLRQQSLLSVKQNTDDKFYIISDFQTGMAEGFNADNKSTALNLIQIKANLLPNIAVDSVWLQGVVLRPDEQQKLIIKLHNYADQKAVNIPLKLIINGKQKALGSYSINANSAVADTLTFSGLQSGWQTALLQLQDNPVTFDNNFYFSFNISATLPVLVITDNQSNPYLKAVFDTEPFFKVKAVNYSNIDYSALSSYSLVVISDIKNISGGLAQQLHTYVNNGGNLAVFPATVTDVNSYRGLLQGLNAPFYGNKSADSTKVSSINANASVYKNTFESIPQNPDLPKIYQYYPLHGEAINFEKLMSLQNGNAFWSGSSYRQGRVYVCAVPLDESFSTLPHNPLFVTTMLRIGLLSGHEQQFYSVIGTNTPIAIKNVALGADDILKLTNGTQEIIPDMRNRDGQTELFIAEQITRPGTYKLMKRDSLVALLSFNSSRVESDMHYLNAVKLKALAGKNGSVIASSQGLLKNNYNQNGLGFQLWKLCLLLALFFLGAEILLIRFYKPRKTPAS